MEEKREKDGGVKFNPTPEVIQVASTTPVDDDIFERNRDVVIEAL